MSEKHALLPADFNSRSPLEQARYLDAAADKVIRDETIRKPLSDDQKETLRYELEQFSIKLADVQDQYEDVKKEWREEIDGLKKSVNNVLDQLRSGQEVLTCDVFEIRDYDTNRVTRFAQDGTEIGTRPLLPEERQSTIHSGIRKVENDS